MSSLPGSPSSIAISTKGGKKGKAGPVKLSGAVAVQLDVATAKTLLTALALALSTPINNKKKGKNGKSGKGPKGGLKAGKVA